MSEKSFVLLSGMIEGWMWSIQTRINSDGKFRGRGIKKMENLKERYMKNTEKSKMRILDKAWCYRNIPSSIVWRTEIHHDWKDGARMYLLTKGEHILKEREVRSI